MMAFGFDLRVRLPVAFFDFFACTFCRIEDIMHSCVDTHSSTTDILRFWNFARDIIDVHWSRKHSHLKSFLLNAQTELYTSMHCSIGGSWQTSSAVRILWSRKTTKKSIQNLMATVAAAMTFLSLWQRMLRHCYLQLHATHPSYRLQLKCSLGSPSWG